MLNHTLPQTSDVLNEASFHILLDIAQLRQLLEFRISPALPYPQTLGMIGSQAEIHLQR